MKQHFFKFRNFFTVVGLLLFSVMNAQTTKISGTVSSSDDKSTLPGVNITVKGQKTSTQTDVNGTYSIQAKKGEVLVFSFMGFTKQEKKIEEDKTINIVLVSEAELLKDVVVVGYGSQKKVNLTGAVAQIDAKVFEDRPITRLSEGLQGAIAGLNITAQSAGGTPNATQNINIRGFTGLGVTGGPLIVIDGIQGGDMNALNPSDVESISVIKDAAASAVYGSSAPYGVILITTKKGKKGKPISITFNGSYNYATPIGLPKFANSLDFARIMNQTMANGGQPAFFDQPTIDRMIAYQNGTLLTETEANLVNDTWKANGGANSNNDWFDILYKDMTFAQQHNLGISGAGENSTYFVGVGYNKKEGLFRYAVDDFSRMNLRVNLSSNVTKWLTFNFRGAYSRDEYNAPTRITMELMSRNHPNIALYNPDGGGSNNAQVWQQQKGGNTTSVNDKPVLTGEFEINFAKGWTGTVNYTYAPVFYEDLNVNKTYSYVNPSDYYV